MNAAARVIDHDNLDDDYFSALVGAAKLDAEISVDDAVKRLARYSEVMPSGRHVQDAVEWRMRLRGELKSLLDKTSDR